MNLDTFTIIVHTDGGSRGNPGPAAIGAVIERSGQIMQEISQTIGITTNNVAEYSAIRSALTWIRDQQLTQPVECFLDSELVVKQLQGLYKVKDEKMKQFWAEVKMLEKEIPGIVTYHAIRRELNTHADMLVNRALDNA